jgi:hypothetical protein
MYLPIKYHKQIFSLSKLSCCNVYIFKNCVVCIKVLRIPSVYGKSINTYYVIIHHFRLLSKMATFSIPLTWHTFKDLSLIFWLIVGPGLSSRSPHLYNNIIKSDNIIIDNAVDGIYNLLHTYVKRTLLNSPIEALYCDRLLAIAIKWG